MVKSYVVGRCTHQNVVLKQQGRQAGSSRTSIGRIPLRQKLQYPRLSTEWARLGAASYARDTIAAPNSKLQQKTAMAKRNLLIRLRA